jgi:hypothetical protein
VASEYPAATLTSYSLDETDLPVHGTASSTVPVSGATSLRWPHVDTDAGLRDSATRRRAAQLAWCTPQETERRLTAMLGRRIAAARDALGSDFTLYLEDGYPTAR